MILINVTGKRNTQSEKPCSLFSATGHRALLRPLVAACCIERFSDKRNLETSNVSSREGFQPQPLTTYFPNQYMVLL